uniref:helix-turn-helix domain-containing protein n=1 Tax=Catenulispora rubra TaxID=280293 RepID=UPI0018928649
PLAPMTDRRWVIPTVDAYLSQGGRLKEVASVLNVHQNTVKYRISELRPFLDLAAYGGERSATLLLAVRVHIYLSAVTKESVL